MMSRKLIFVVSLFVMLQATTAHAFYCIEWDAGRCVYWAGGNTTMLGFLGTPGAPLLNGTLSWDQNAFDAANDWNAVGAIHFTVNNGTNFLDPCGAQDGQRHVCTNTGPRGDNPIFFASTFCGQQFGDIIELTNNCWRSDNGQMLNAPVFVNANVLWNAYDGTLRFSSGRIVYDIRRVLVHELGHVLGLDHPDAHAQTVQAIMNSRVSNIDRLQADDINGARSIYSSVPNNPSAPTSGTTGCQMQTKQSSSNLLLVLSGLAIACKRRRVRSQSTNTTPATSPPTP